MTPKFSISVIWLPRGCFFSSGKAAIVSPWFRTYNWASPVAQTGQGDLDLDTQSIRACTVGLSVLRLGQGKKEDS